MSTANFAILDYCSLISLNLAIAGRTENPHRGGMRGSAGGQPDLRDLFAVRVSATYGSGTLKKGQVRHRSLRSRPFSNEVHRFACFVNAPSELLEEWGGPKRKVAFQIFGAWSVTRHGTAKVPCDRDCAVFRPA